MEATLKQVEVQKTVTVTESRVTLEMTPEDAKILAGVIGEMNSGEGAQKLRVTQSQFRDGAISPSAVALAFNRFFNAIAKVL